MQGWPGTLRRRTSQRTSDAIRYLRSLDRFEESSMALAGVSRVLRRCVRNCDPSRLALAGGASGFESLIKGSPVSFRTAFLCGDNRPDRYVDRRSGIRSRLAFDSSHSWSFRFGSRLLPGTLLEPTIFVFPDGQTNQNDPENCTNDCHDSEEPNPRANDPNVVRDIV